MIFIIDTMNPTVFQWYDEDLLEPTKGRSWSMVDPYR